MNFLSFLEKNIVYLDGGMGTLLQKKGLKAGEYPERWNITHSDTITEIHRAYFEAGSNVVATNTFGANSLKFSDDELEDVIKSAIENAERARAGFDGERFIALDIGPTGKLLKPLGDLDFEDAVSVFAKSARLGEKYGADLVIIETMSCSYETKAALLAVKENTSLPVIVSNAYGEDGKLMTGASPAAMVALLEGMGADAIGANCSLGPKELKAVAEELLRNASVPVILKPNAGLPRSVNGETVFDITPEEFARELYSIVEKGVRVVGGCCGTTPEYIKRLVDETKALSPKPVTEKNITVVSSYSDAVKFGEYPVLIGERINPTGKKRFKEALIENDIDYILSEGVREEEKGVHILDVNVGLPEIDECEMLERVVRELQAVVNLPLQIDTSSPQAMERALRLYNGKAMINSVNGKKESMAKVFPLAKKYGGVVVALTLDENGIPATAEGRVEIARRILKTAEEYGLSKKDIVFDTLAMTVSADARSAGVTLDALDTIKNEMGVHTSLGVSNISFGLPNRDAINGVFFALALERGLSAAIMNPHSAEMMKTFYAFNALHGLDESCKRYIEVADSFNTIKGGESIKNSITFSSDLQRAIVKGLRESASEITKKLLSDRAPLDIVNGEIIPALNIVGEGFERKTVYLPELLMSAEAAASSFEVIKSSVKRSDDGNAKTVVLATVKGDIHDIGKNIVKLLLENYGFKVIDLGKDVPPERVLERVTADNITLVGLSALMTTTVPAMAETIALLHDKAPRCRVVVGGAVLTESYAESIGADAYASDAMEAVKCFKDLSI